MLEKTGRWMIGFLLAGGMLVLLGLSLSSEISLGASQDPFDEYAEPYQFTLSTPVSSEDVTAAANGSDWTGWWTTTQDFPTNSLGEWDSVNQADPGGADTWGPGIITRGTNGNHNWGAWVRGNAVQADLSSSTVFTYAPNMDTWLVYGPLSASDEIWHLKLAFDYFISLGTGDTFIAGYSTDGTNFQGLRVHSLKMDPGAWAGTEVKWPVNRQADQLWVAFGFTSDDEDEDQGVWLDSLELSANYGGRAYLPLLANNWAEIPEIQGFFDDFSDPESGWNDRLYQHGDGVDLMRVGYVDERYRMKILLNYNDRNNRLMGMTKAPYEEEHTQYDVQVRHGFVKSDDQVVEPEFGKAGMVFAANDNFSTLYVFEWNYEGNCAVNKFTKADYPITYYENSDYEEHTIMSWQDCAGFKLDGGYDADNQVMVEVRDNKATIYVLDGDDKIKVRDFTDDELRNRRRVGLVTGSWDFTPVNSRFDDFWIKPVD